MAHRNPIRNANSLRCRPRPLAQSVAQAFARPVWGAGMLALLGSLGLPALAGPQGAQVVAGQATVQQGGPVTTVHQTTQRAIIDWRSFNVGANETVRFQQPNSQAATLNRVLGNDPSAIFGRVEANGQIFLVNPNGIVFGRTARVDVGALVASTANVSNTDFMAGRLNFSQPGKAGAQVVNEGEITVAEGGLAALVGPSVSNRGLITAKLAKVALAAGEAFTLDLRGDQLFQLVVPSEALSSLTDAAGRPLAALLDHSGQIAADGGFVLLTAATASRLMDSLIHVSGGIRATTASATPGRISLRGDAGTRLTLSGSLEASGELGGRIEVTAREVELALGARLDASGVQGGGTVSVGGDWQGRGALPNAQRVDVAAGVSIDASARERGDGGTVVIWSDGDTRFAGKIESRGGVIGGHGGQVEVSGKGRLGFDGDVDASAALGRAGSLLLDPTNLVIDGSAGATSLPGAGAGDFTVRVSALNRQLQLGTSVTVQADNDITVNANAQIDARGGAGVAGGGLKLDAGRNVSLNGFVILNNGRFEVDARAGSFTQATGVSIATGTGSIDIESAGALRATNLLSSGDVRLSSSAGAVQVTEALGAVSGTGIARLASLTATGTSVALNKDALVQGAISLTATAGSLTSATLDSRTSVAVQARDAVVTGALLTPGAVLVTSSVGAVSLGAVASEPADAGSFAGRKAASLTVRAAGAVSLAGAALGAGGLRVEGAGGAGTRAGVTSFSAAGVFSAGDVIVDSAGDINFAGSAGIDGGAAVTLNGGAGITTGAGALRAATTVRLSAAGALTLGTGGVLAQGTGIDALLLQAGGLVTLNGRVESAGSLRVATTGGNSHVLANADVVASGVTVVSGGRFDQLLAGKVIDSRSGALSVTSAGALSATNLLSTGAVTLTSTGASVKVSEALGRTAARVGSVAAKAALDLELSKGALVAGTTTLAAGEGAATVGKLTLGATLDSIGAITLDADNGIDTRALMSASSIDVTGTKTGLGAMNLGAVSGSISGTNQALSGTSPKADAVTVRSAGDVAMGGGVAAASLLLAGVDTAAASRAGGSVTLSGGSVYTTGGVGLRSAGALTLADAAGIDSTGRLVLDSSSSLVTGSGGLRSGTQAELVAGGALTIGSGGVQAQATGVDALVMRAGGVATLSGPLASAGGVSLTTTGAGSHVLANADVLARGVTVEAGGRFEQAAARVIDAGAGNLSVTSAGALSASNLLTSGDLALTSTGANVKVSEALGRTAAPLARLTVLAATDLELAKGALVAGTATVLTAGTGGVSGTLSLAGTLDSRGSITLSSLGALGAADLLTPGDVTVSSTAGPVTLGAIAARATTADNFANEKSGVLLVRSGGSVQFNAGAAVASLQVAGAGSANRAGGSVGFANAGVFSTGDVALRSTGAITFAGQAGIDTAAALTLDAGASLTTAAGGLKAGTKAALTTGGALTVGSGGLQADASGADALVLTAAGVVTLDGKLQSSSGATSVITTGASSNVNVSATAGIDALGLTINAAGAFTQTGTSLVLDARSGLLSITSAGAMSATNLFTTGAVTLTSMGSSVKVSEALGRTASRLGSLEVKAATDVELNKGALVAGTTTLTAGNGTAAVGKLTLGATLDSTAGITLEADNGIETGALMSGGTGTVNVTGTKTGVGSVKLGAVSGSISGTAQALTGSSARTGALTVRSAGDVTLDGGAAVASLLVANLGTSTTSRAGGSLTLSGGSVFSTGDVALRSSGAITFAGQAGVDTAAALTLDAGTSLTTAAGGLKAGTKAALTSGGALTVGSGGLQADASGTDALVLAAAGVVTLDGKLQSSSGATSVITTGASSDVNVSATAGIDALGLTINAAGAFTQTGTSLVLDARSGLLSITSAGAMSATNLFSTGRVELTSTGSSVKVSEALGRTASRLGSLEVKAATDVELNKGALVAGTTTLTAGNGTAAVGKLTLGATLDSTAGITLEADNGIATQALMSGSSSAIDVTGTKTGVGSVTLGAVSGSISGEAQALTSSSARTGALTVRSAGDVTLDGGAAVASLQVANLGTSTTSRAGGSLTLSGGSVFSTGDVALRSSGAISFTGTSGIDAGRDVVLDSSAAVSTTQGPVWAARNVAFTGSALTLGPADAAGDPTTACPTGCPSGGVTGVASVTLTATSGAIKAYSKLQTSGGTITVGALDDIELNHVSTWQAGPTDLNSGALLVSGANVTLKQPLGGPSTGFSRYLDGYKRSARPAVGRVQIVASKGVELNGLNIDGNDAAGDATPGLDVRAATFLISNDQIAVNKGDIRLTQEPDPGVASNPVDGIYLGHNIYSRGVDVVTTTGRTRRGYDITVSGLNIVLFDNTTEFADVARVNSRIYNTGLQIENYKNTRIAKIIISNNPANYSDDSTTLVPLTHCIGTVTPCLPLPKISLSGMLSGVILTDPNLSINDRNGALTLGQARNLFVYRQSNLWNTSNNLFDLPPAFGIGGTLFGIYTASVNDAGQVQGSDAGLALKLLSFNLGDQSLAPQGFTVSGTGTSNYGPRPYTQNVPLPSGVDLTRLTFPLSPYNDPKQTFGLVYPAASETPLGGQVEITTGIPAACNCYYQGGIWKDVDTGLTVSPQPDPPKSIYFLTGTTVEARGDGTRVVITGAPALSNYASIVLGYGFAATATNSSAQISTNTSGQLQQITPPTGPTSFTGAAGPNNSAQGFTAQGGFGGVGPGATVGAVGSAAVGTGNVVSGGTGTTSSAAGNAAVATGAVGAVTAAAATGFASNLSTASGEVAVGSAGQTTGAIANTASASDSLGSIASGAASGGAANAAALPAIRVEAPEVDPSNPPSTTRIVDGSVVVGGNGLTLADVLLGRRPAADADLGRAGAGGGSSVNVFQRRYRLGTSANAAVCAPGDLEGSASPDARNCAQSK